LYKPKLHPHIVEMLVEIPVEIVPGRLLVLVDLVA
jgi:hypothetical protein